MKRLKARKPESYVKRTYRTLKEHDLISSFVKIKDTDLHIQADQDVTDDLGVALRRAEEEALMKEVALLFEHVDVRLHLLRGNRFLESEPTRPGNTGGHGR